MTRIALAVTLGLLCAPSFADMRITFIDAGQADAALIQVDQPSGEPFTIIVDGGDHDNDLKDHLPALTTSDPTVELIILSHPHHDHQGALDWLVNDSGKAVEKVWWNGDTRTSGNFIPFRDALIAKGILAIRPEEAFYHVLGVPNVSFRVFNNGGEFPGVLGHDFNNDSLVVQVIYEPATDVKVTALFTGDIEKDQGEM